MISKEESKWRAESDVRSLVEADIIRKDKIDKKDSEEIFKKINNAKELIMKYVTCYRYSFKEKDVKKQTMDKETYKHLKRFYDDWWGKLDF